MVPNDSSKVIYDLLKSSSLMCKQRFVDALKEIDADYASLDSRIHLLKTYGTVRLGVGQGGGNTTAAIKLANEFFKGGAIYLGPRYKSYESMGAPNPDHWINTASQNPTGINAIFVDPGPHAGMQAQRAIYTLAAEAMVISDGLKPVLIYFVGC